MKNVPLLILIIIIFFFVKKRWFDNTDYKSIVKNGGILLDVRSSSEFLNGHIKGAKNIPLSEIKERIDELKDKNQFIITHCASGIRSQNAKMILSSKGYQNVINGGGWRSLNTKLKR